MKAKITYTVSLDEVPSEVSALLQKIQFQIDKDVSGKLIQSYPVTSENVMGTLEMIDHVRRSMAEIDARLEDCHAIILGYIQHKHAEVNSSSETESKTSYELENEGDNLDTE